MDWTEEMARLGVQVMTSDGQYREWTDVMRDYRDAIKKMGAGGMWIKR